MYYSILLNHVVTVWSGCHFQAGSCLHWEYNVAHNLQKRLTLEYICLLNVSISFYSVLWKKQAKLEPFFKRRISESIKFNEINFHSTWSLLFLCSANQPLDRDGSFIFSCFRFKLYRNTNFTTGSVFGEQVTGFSFILLKRHSHIKRKMSGKSEVWYLTLLLDYKNIYGIISKLFLVNR